MTEEPRTYRTKTGRILTDEDIQTLADEAEHGYNVVHVNAYMHALIREFPAFATHDFLHSWSTNEEYDIARKQGLFDDTMTKRTEDN